MSTEPPSTEPPVAPHSATAARRFRRTLYGTIAVLGLVVAGLVVLNLGQGPRLASAQINLTGAVERSGQRLLLQSNEPLAAITDAQVSITPATALTATTTASNIEVTFNGALRYNTTYTVNVEGVRSSSAPATSTFNYTFSTPDPTVYALVPGASGAATTTGASGRIISTPLSGGSPTTVFTAPHIRRFVTFPDSIVVDTVDDDGTDALTIVSLTGAPPIPIQLAGPGTVTSLLSLPGSNLFGFTYTAEPSPLYETSPDLLFAYDLTRGQDFTIPITGTDHEQFTAAEWMFVPGTTSLVARTSDGSLLLVDTLGERDGTSGAVPIGAAGSTDDLVGFVPGTKKLVTRSGDTFTAHDLGATGNPSTPFTLAGTPAETSAPAEPGSTLESGDSVQILDASGSTLRVESDASGASAVRRVDASGATTVFTAPAQTGPVTAVCLSPNAGYAVVETSGPAPRLTYLDLADGSTVSTLAGSRSSWCNA